MKMITGIRWLHLRMKTDTMANTEKGAGKPAFFYARYRFFLSNPDKEESAKKRNPTGSFYEKRAKPTAPLNTRNFGKVTCGKR